ncbi:uncharacterized protein LOC142472633 [Ascaphus truei]|uniref:uncharacterized protein LOC142472633 n=1 Tax=Ascaphus truei TaxID=8439 RepID=UPI003F5970A4
MMGPLCVLCICFFSLVPCTHMSLAKIECNETVAVPHGGTAQMMCRNINEQTNITVKKCEGNQTEKCTITLVEVSGNRTQDINGRFQLHKEPPTATLTISNTKDSDSGSYTWNTASREGHPHFEFKLNVSDPKNTRVGDNKDKAVQGPPETEETSDTSAKTGWYIVIPIIVLLIGAGLAICIHKKRIILVPAPQNESQHTMLNVEEDGDPPNV